MEEVDVRATRITGGGGGVWTLFGEFWGVSGGFLAQQGSHDHFSTDQDPGNAQEDGADKEPAADTSAPDPMQNTADHDSCVDRCRTRLEPAVQGAAGAAGGGVAGLALGGPKALVAGAAIGGVVGTLSGAGAPGAVAVPYAGAAGATADMIVGGGGGMSNPFSRGGWIASLIGTAASRTPADARTQVTIGAAAGAYVDGIAAARAAGFSYAGSNLGGRTAFAVVAAGFAANFTYRWADGKATQYCEGYCGR
jgi:hypothetical protein